MLASRARLFAAPARVGSLRVASSWEFHVAGPSVEVPRRAYSGYNRSPFQVHPPPRESLLGRACAVLDSWFTDRVLTMESRAMRQERYMRLWSRYSITLHEEIPVDRPKSVPPPPPIPHTHTPVVVVCLLAAKPRSVARRCSPLARLGAAFVDGLVIATATSAVMMVPLLGPVLSLALAGAREVCLSRWGDMQSPGRALFGLRCVSLSGPHSEASSLVLRTVLTPTLLMGTSVLAIVPFIGPVFPLVATFALMALPLQTMIGNGRTWLDRLANTQVIREK